MFLIHCVFTYETKETDDDDWKSLIGRPRWRELLQRLPLIDRGVVDENVDATHAFLDACDASRDGDGVGHVEGRFGGDDRSQCGERSHFNRDIDEVDWDAGIAKLLEGKALMAKASDLLADPPAIHIILLLANKPPR